LENFCELVDEKGGIDSNSIVKIWLELKVDNG
jgi:hypothetical protein